MMTQLRSQMKLILWILVFAFLLTIVFSWGMGGFKDTRDDQGLLGEIDGFEITAESFENLINRQAQARASQGEADLGADEFKKLRDDGWNDQVEAVLKGFEARELDINVTNREIAYLVEKNPPAEIMEVELFLTEGEFDLQKYQTFLRDPQAAEFLIGLEASVRNFLMENKLTFYVSQAAAVTEEEVLDEYLSSTATGKLHLIALIFDDFDQDTTVVTGEMEHRYYRVFQQRYKTYAQRQFAYVKFDLEPTRLDSQDIRKDAEELIAELRDGEDFAELARLYSTDEGSAKEGGDLGWFGSGAMTEEFEEAAFAAKPGEIVGPVESKFGFHIIQVEDKRREEGEDQIKARHILLKIEPSSDSRDQVYTDAYTFAQDARIGGFAALADEFDYSVDTTSMFSKSGYIARLGRMRMAALFCFNNPIGTISDVYPVPDAYVVFQITDASEDGYKPFEDVQKSIRKALLKITNRNHVFDLASEIRGKIESHDDMISVAAEYGFTVYTTQDSLKPNGALPEGLKRDAELLTETFRLEEGEISDVITGKRGAYIVYLEEKSSFNREDYKISHFAIYQKLISKKREQAVRNWIRELRIAADIKDYRYKFYRDF